MELLLIAIVLGLLPAAIAHSKGRGFFRWWLYGAALFIVALPHAILARRDTARLERRALKTDAKKCPRCAELVKAEASLCRFCGHEFRAGT